MATTLTIDPDQVCFLILKAREFDAKMEPEVPDPGDNPTDDDEREVLFDYPDDPTAEEIKAYIGALNVDEAAELLALVWVGSGDYTAGEWRQAVAAARDDPDSRRAKALLAIPLLGDYLEEGLAALGYSCRDVDAEHL